METTFIAQLWAGIETFFASINWLFLVVFVTITWLLNEGTDSCASFKWLNWLQGIPRKWRTIISGLLMALIFAYLYDLRTKVEIAGLIYSIILGMIIWKLGLDSFFEWFKQRIWMGKAPEKQQSDK